MRIRPACKAALNAGGFAVDIEGMHESASKPSPFEQNCLTVLNCYAVRDAAAKAATSEYAGWLDRIQDVADIEKSSLTSIHGFLIAQGLIRFEFTGRSVGLQYQLSTQGREAIARESVYLSDDPHRSENGSQDNESVSQAA
ncbi:MAG: hypothetical protein O2856_02935 [Planctomycetota bacterium]|nr:hypothetical protein [Planctomycetota bacterium]